MEYAWFRVWLDDFNSRVCVPVAPPLFPPYIFNNVQLGRLALCLLCFLSLRICCVVFHSSELGGLRHVAFSYITSHHIMSGPIFLLLARLDGSGRTGSGPWRFMLSRFLLAGFTEFRVLGCSLRPRGGKGGLDNK